MARPNEDQRTVRESLKVGAATLLSRFLGLGRDILLAITFGTSYIFDAWVMAFTMPNMFRRLLAEGAVSAAFVPEFSRRLDREGRSGAWPLLRVSLTFVLMVSSAITFLMILGAEPLASLLCWRFDGGGEDYGLLVLLIRLVFPFLIFISLAALFMGALYSLGHFIFPSLAPAVFNVVWIGGILSAAYWYHGPPEKKIIIMASAVLAGGLVQFLMQWPKLRGYGFKVGWSLNWRQPGFPEMCRLMLPVLAGVGVALVNVMVTRVLAYRLGQGALSSLYFADRLVQLPLGVYALSFATVSLPLLSKQAAAGDMLGLRHSFQKNLRHVLYIILPAAVGLTVLGREIISLFFRHGRFDVCSQEMSFAALAFLALGLPFFSAHRLVLQVFYALQQIKTTVYVGALAVLANAGLGIILMEKMGLAGIALAISLSTLLNYMLLYYLAGKRIGTLIDGESWKMFLRCAVCAAGTAWFALWAKKTCLLMLAGGGLLGEGGRLLLVLVSSAGVYFLLTSLARVPEAGELWTALRGRKKP